MSCKFSCFISFTNSLKENDVGVFQSDNGDEYTVRYRSNVCRDLLLTIEWRIPKQVLVTVKLYNTTFKRCFSSRGMVVNGKKTFMKLRGAFNVSSSQNYKVLCVINLIPYIKFNAFNEIASQSFDSGFAEPDIQLSSTEEYNNFDNTNFRRENIEEYGRVENSSNIEANETAASNEFENSESTMEIEHQNELDKILSNDSLKIKVTNVLTSENISSTNETEISVKSSSNNDVFSSDKCDKKNSNICEALNSVGYFNSEKIWENSESTFKNIVLENKEDKFIKKSNIKIDEFVSSNDFPVKIHETVENKNEDVNADIRKDDIYKKMARKSNTDVYSNIKSADISAEKNLIMEVDIPHLSPENLESHDKERLTGKSIPNVNEMFISSIQSLNLNQQTVTDISELIENVPTSHNELEITHISNSEINMMLESNDMSVKSNQSFGDDLTSYRNTTITGDQELLKDNEGSHLVSVKYDSPPTNIQETLDEIEDIKIITDTTGYSKSNSPDLLSSKTNLVFQTLVRKLSIDDCDRESNINEEAENKISSESELTYTKAFPSMESELKGLSMDMLDLLTSGDMVDAVISNGEKSIKVHRAIVSARSSVLKQMFTEQTQDAIKYSAIVDIPSCILEDIIIFFYVGLVYIKNTKMAHDLYEVARRYRINDLIDICSKHVSK